MTHIEQVKALMKENYGDTLPCESMTDDECVKWFLCFVHSNANSDLSTRERMEQIQHEIDNGVTYDGIAEDFIDLCDIDEHAISALMHGFHRK